MVLASAVNLKGTTGRVEVMTRSSSRATQELFHVIFLSFHVISCHLIACHVI